MVRVRSDLPALVLESHDYGESDKIVTFFCQEIGRLTLFAKGAHRSKKRFTNKLELFSFVQISYSRRSAAGLALLDEAELINSFISLRLDFTRYLAASVIREYMLLVTNETLNDDNIFQLALWALHSLNQAGNRRQVVALFLVKLFDYLGYRPNFSSCQKCGRNPENGDSAVFSTEAGGIVCSRCSPPLGAASGWMTSGAMQMIGAVQQQPVNRLSRFKPAGTVLDQMLDYAYRYSRYLFQRDIHSWKSFVPRSLPR
ncbi:MAG: DNA repair protein RecO [Desulfofustis sp.]|jgi:DNA repair protein RecO (recombination protein O)|nr:DNA repair protein RecO [Desulfofustis sp.]